VVRRECRIPALIGLRGTHLKETGSLTRHSIGSPSETIWRRVTPTLDVRQVADDGYRILAPPLNRILHLLELRSVSPDVRGVLGQLQSGAVAEFRSGAGDDVCLAFAGRFQINTSSV
jgi:hypothetical protein